MAKPIIHIGLAVCTDGFLPGKANILNISAYQGTHTFSQNILPEYGHYKPSKLWEKYPEMWDSFKSSPSSYIEGVRKFSQWLDNFQGNLIACASSADFWHIFVALTEVTTKCQFGALPLDTNSYLAAIEGLKAPKRLKGIISPVEVAKTRWELVTNGVVPKVTPIVAKSKKKVVEIAQPRWAQPPLVQPQVHFNQAMRDLQNLQNNAQQQRRVEFFGNEALNYFRIDEYNQ